MGVKIFSLEINKNNKLYNFTKKVSKFRKLINKQNPDIIQSWMYHSNFLTLFTPILFYNKVYWNIRHSELNLKISKKFTILISIVCGICSNFFCLIKLFIVLIEVEFFMKIIICIIKKNRSLLKMALVTKLISPK